MKFRLAPSVLSADFAELGAQVSGLEAAGADQVHVDVMDGHFVPNLTMGPIVVEALRRSTRLPLDVHLMITDPGAYIDAFIEAGAAHVSFHVEVTPEPQALASRLHAAGLTAGLAVNPETNLERVLPVAHDFDMILVMTVQPGFGGQAFMAENLEKVRSLREWEKASNLMGGKRLDIEVDGGINRETIVAARDAGANVFVAGNSIFSGGDPAAAVAKMRQALL